LKSDTASVLILPHEKFLKGLEVVMKKKPFLSLIIITVLILLFSGCSETNRSYSFHTGASFLRGTLVQTEQGAVAIENLVPGMRVSSYSIETGNRITTPVLGTGSRDYSGPVVTVAAAGNRVECTPSHPFLVTEISQDNLYRAFLVSGNTGWIQAQYLEPGDTLLLHPGVSSDAGRDETVQVSRIDQRNVVNSKVYDITAAATHTIIVGSAESAGMVTADGTITITKGAAYYSRSGGGGCLPEGTGIRTDSGLQAIEQILPGDTVHAFDPGSGQWTAQEVSQIERHLYSGNWITINPGLDEIQVSGNHPFFLISGIDYDNRPAPLDVPWNEQGPTEHGRWVEARHLMLGDALLASTGEIDVITLSRTEKLTTVYNLKVTEVHSYSIGQWGVLVHNKGAAESADVSTATVAESAPVAEKSLAVQPGTPPPVEYNTEEYGRIYEQRFLNTLDNPLSTLSIDVDTASYSNVRRFLQNGNLPQPDAVRIEEFINYFNYDYPRPTGEHPFTFYTELSVCPWNSNHGLLHVGLQGLKIDFEDLPPNNLVFLLDVSGSMQADNKLPLLKESLALLIGQMREIDTISIVVYAGAAGLVLPPTTCSNKAVILGAMDRLKAGGSTAGGAGIQLAYAVAKEHFNPQGNNRVILGTDGDFNVGQSSNAALVRLIEEKREEGVYLTILGFGMGNYKDSKMEELSNAGNGNYAYIDTLREAEKVLVREISGTLYAIAKDVKIQIEFNPAVVQSYRIIGYENRLLNAEDFADDRKDAGEMGAGHTVTVLYELTFSDGRPGESAQLRYQTSDIKEGAAESNEIMFLKFRYKRPEEEQSRLIEQPVPFHLLTLADTSPDYRFSASVAGFGLLLRDSQYKGSLTYPSVLQLAESAIGQDMDGDRGEFIGLVKLAQWINDSAE
jgi:Ca-activated chloride channel family protein